MRVLLLGGHWQSFDKKLIDSSSYPIVACQRAVMSTLADRASYVTVYDAAAPHKLGFNDHAWIHRRQIVVKPAVLFKNHGWLYPNGEPSDKTWSLRVWDVPRSVAVQGARYCGPWSIYFAVDQLGAHEVYLHGFSCKEDKVYERQLPVFNEVARLVSDRCKVYETPGSLLGQFEQRGL